MIRYEMAEQSHDVGFRGNRESVRLEQAIQSSMRRLQTSNRSL